MSNVLGNLFQEIAEAIRGKTGNSGTMKPAEFPANINSIVQTGETKQLTYKFATVPTVTSDIMTINHNMGVVPDIIMFLPNNPPTASTLVYSIGMSTAMINALRTDEYPAKTGYIATFTDSNNGTNSYYGVTLGTCNGHEGDPEYPQYGAVRGVTATSFTVGGTMAPLSRAASGYIWIAIAGIS